MKKISFLLLLCVTGFLTVAQQVQISTPTVKRPVYFDVSPPLRDMAFLNEVKPDISWKDGVVRNNFNSRRIDSQIPAPDFRDVSIQSQFGPLQTDTI
ncbi:MAG: hypothetical protein ABSD71_04620, partial [Bacteroidales bacterium]